MFILCLITLVKQPEAHYNMPVGTDHFLHHRRRAPGQGVGCFCLLEGCEPVEELRPCPKCGSRDIGLCFDGQLFSVWCCDCNLSTDCYIAG